MGSNYNKTHSKITAFIAALLLVLLRLEGQRGSWPLREVVDRLNWSMDGCRAPHFNRFN